MRPRVILCELLTAAWYIYFLLCTYVDWDLYSIVTALDRALLAIGALTVAWATWKHHRWAPKSAVIVAAFIGLPTLTTTVGRLAPILDSDTLSLAIWFGVLPIVLLSQLLAFVEGLRQLRSPDAAA